MPPNPLLTAPVQLVADDQVEIERTGARLIARPPASIRGLIEVRGVGVVAVPYVDEAEVALVADLVRPEDVERLPEPGLLCMIAGVDLPYLKLAPFEPSAPLKLLLSLALYKC
jgi:serine kinase of HPr protein (carbohydrate metabolism regulator)